MPPEAVEISPHNLKTKSFCDTPCCDEVVEMRQTRLSAAAGVAIGTKPLGKSFDVLEVRVVPVLGSGSGHERDGVPKPQRVS